MCHSFPWQPDSDIVKEKIDIQIQPPPQNIDVTPPTLSLVMVTYRRETSVLRQLETLLPYRGLFHEVILVDNHPAGGLAHDAARLWGGGLTVIAQPENLGAVARSIGICASSGDIIVTLDDDVQLADPNELSGLRALFACGAPVGCVNFRILYGDGRTLDLSDWCHPREPDIDAQQLFETTYISEGACALNGRLARELGGYPLDLFIGQEGIDLAARILDRNYGIFYLPSVTVHHTVASEGRATGRQFYFNTRNIYWIALRRYPFGLALRTIAREWLMLLGMSLLRRRLKYFLQGAFDGLRHTTRLLDTRQPISSVTAYRISRLTRLKPSIWRRLRRIRASKTLD
jgi:GT2 family glycosyltransferase